MLKLITKPTWHDYAPGVRLLIAPLTRSKLRQLVAASEEDGAPSLEQLVANHTLQGWEGLADDEGQTLDVTPENAMLVMDSLELGPWIEERARVTARTPEDELKN